MANDFLEYFRVKYNFLPRVKHMLTEMKIDNLQALKSLNDCVLVYSQPLMEAIQNELSEPQAEPEPVQLSMPDNNNNNTDNNHDTNNFFDIMNVAWSELNLSTEDFAAFLPNDPELPDLGLNWEQTFSELLSEPSSPASPFTEPLSVESVQSEPVEMTPQFRAVPARKLSAPSAPAFNQALMAEFISRVDTKCSDDKDLKQINREFLQIVPAYRMRLERGKFSCSICGHNEKRVDYLTTHLARHAMLKRYGCDLCGKRFLRVDEKKRHQTHHCPNRPHNRDILSPTRRRG